jgi:hypothetical protein
LLVLLFAFVVTQAIFAQELSLLITTGGPFTALGLDVGINAKGVIAFTANDANGSAAFTVDEAGVVRKHRFQSSNRTFGTSVAIKDANPPEIAVLDLVRGSPPTIVMRRWVASGKNAFNVVGLLPGLAGLGDTPGRWSLTFENLRNDEMLERLAQAALDIAVTTRFEPDNRLRAEVVGLIEYALFVPQGLMPRRSVRRGRSSSRSGGVLEGLPLAVLNSRSGGILRALESEASRTDCELRVALRLSSYPQLAMAVRSGTVAAVMPTRAAAALEGTQFEIHCPPFLAKEKRKVWIAWNRSMAEIRPAIPAAVRHLKRAVV